MNSANSGINTTVHLLAGLIGCALRTKGFNLTHIEGVRLVKSIETMPSKLEIMV